MKAKDYNPENRDKLLKALDELFIGLSDMVTKNPNAMRAIFNALPAISSIVESNPNANTAELLWKISRHPEVKVMKIASIGLDILPVVKAVQTIILYKPDVIAFGEKITSETATQERTFIEQLLGDGEFKRLITRHSGTVRSLLPKVVPPLIKSFLAGSHTGLQSSLNVVLQGVVSSLVAEVAKDPAKTLFSISKVVGTFILAGQRSEGVKTAEEAVAVDKEFADKKLKALLPVLAELPLTIFPAIAQLLDHGVEIAALVAPLVPGVAEAAFRDAKALAEGKKWGSTKSESFVPAPLRLLSGVDPKFLEAVLPPIIGLAHALSVDGRIQQVILAVNSIMNDASTQKIKRSAVTTIIAALEHVSTFIAGDFAQALGDGRLIRHQEALRTIVVNAAGLFEIEPTKALVDSTISILPEALPLVGRMSGKALKAGLKDVYVAVSEKPVNLRAVVAALPALVKEVLPILEHDLPNLLRTKQADIAALLEQALALPQVKALIGENKDAVELVGIAAPVALKVVPEILPHAAKVVDLVLQDQPAMAVLSDMLPPKQEGQKTVSALTIARTVFRLVRNPEVRSSLSSIVGVLKSHESDLEKIVGSFVSKTELGKSLDVQSLEFLSLAKTKLPEITEIADRYLKGRRVNAILSCLGLLISNPRLIILGVKALRAKKARAKALTHVERFKRRRPPPIAVS